MSIYKHKELDFIKRTRTIVKEYKGKDDVTLLLNCFIGLLIIPKEKLYDKLPQTDMNLEDWGINVNDITFIEGGKINVQQVARRMRNSITHNNFTIKPESKDSNAEIESIKFEDYIVEKKNGKETRRKTFEANITIEDLKKFTKKFSLFAYKEIAKSLGVPCEEEESNW